MANAFYDKWKTSLQIADANVSLDVDTTVNGVYVALVTSAYVFSQTHQFFSSLSGIVGTNQRITTPTVGSVGDGIFDGDDLTFPSIATGSTVAAIVAYRHNAGANTTWRLIWYRDTETGLPVVTNGGDITVVFNAAGIHKL